MLACQRDPTLRFLQTEVVSCTANGDAFEIVLADTILYPEGGGQPADHGRIGGARIRDVQRVGGVVIHTANRRVELGPTRVEVDWSRRFDHMQQHTAQHLLTAVAQDRYGWATTSFHLYEDRCDIEVDVAAVGSSEILALEAAVNAEIRAARPVGMRVVDRTQFAELEVRTRGLPDDVEQIRLVEIEGLDRNTCGGTHVRNTSQIGRIQLLGAEKLRGGTRLFFIAGDRIGTWLRRSMSREAALSRVLSSAPRDHLAAVEKILSDGKASNKAQRLIRGELASLLGNELARAGNDTLALHRADADMGFLNQVASAAVAIRPDVTLLLTAGESAGVFLLVAPIDRLNNVKSEVLEILGGRGGGPPGRLQGRATRIDRRNDALAALGISNGRD